MQADINTTKYVNVVFQGGGVRGITYAGVLHSIPPHVSIYGAAGTSAGAIVAALLSILKTPDQIKAILERDDLYKLIEDAEEQRMGLIRNAWNDLKNVITETKGEKTISIPRVIKFAWKHKDTFSHLKTIWDQRGFHSSARLRTFLDEILEGKKFCDVKINDLKIVAADIDRQKYRIYSKLKDPEIFLAEAVHASVSIPIFFQPFRSGPDHYVDGGILSNFPAFLFTQGYYKTVGFRLGDIEPPQKIDSTSSFLKSLLFTMTDAHDKERGEPPHFKCFEIKAPSDIPSTKFALSKKDVGLLYQLGLEVGKQVDWDNYASETQTISHYDPKPDDTLQLSLKQAYELFQRYANSRVEKLNHEIAFEVHLKHDWSCRYVRTTTFRVEGKKHLFLQRFIGEGTSASRSRPQSLIDFPFEANEILADGEELELVHIPAYNTENEKGFLLFYTPPVTSDHPRTFRTAFEISREFEKSIKEGRDGRVACSTRRLADDHRLSLKFEIFIDSTLPQLRLNSEFGEKLSYTGLVEGSTAIYRHYAAEVKDITVDTPVDFGVIIQRHNGRRN